MDVGAYEPNEGLRQLGGIQLCRCDGMATGERAVKFLFEPTVRKDMHPDRPWYGPVNGTAHTGKTFHSSSTIQYGNFLTIEAILQYLRIRCS